MTGDDQKRTLWDGALWDGSLPFRGEIRRLGSLLPSRSREGPDYVPLSQPSPLKGRGLNVSSPPPKAAVLLALCSAATHALSAPYAQLSSENSRGGKGGVVTCIISVSRDPQ